jgi:hypothetical protein
MFQKLSSSWELVKASARVLKADKELLVFPMISSIGLIIVSALFIIPIFLANAFDTMFVNGSIQVAGVVVVFLFYLVQYFVIFFANTALVGAAMIRLRGGDPTLGDGFRIAFSRFWTILGYALISATVGMILKAISEKSGMLGKIIISIIGFVWNIATYLVVPILAVEGVGPIEAIKRSAGLLRKTWGQQIIGNLGLGTVFGLIVLVIFVVGIPVIIFAAAGIQSTALTILVSLLFAFILIAVGLIQSTLNGIYTAAVYQYAADGQTGSFFDPMLIKEAFRPK